MDFSNVLVQWYLQNKRDLPWRKTSDPYLIWLSEIMLQQTRVAQGLPYFMAFTEAFPTVFDLANASEQQVLKLWQGLGYYSRARNLHSTAKYVAFELDGVFPDNYKELLKLKGVGEYTAAAIASFSYGEAVPVVDGNVFRVLSRCFGIETDIAQSSAKKEFQELAFELMLKNQPAIFNQAIMEFGALQCVPKNPDCRNCVFNNSCVALQKNMVDVLPVKSKKVKVKSRYFNYLVIQDLNGSMIVSQRTGKGIWQNLYEFPLIETVDDESEDAVLSKIGEHSLINGNVFEAVLLNDENIVHKLSHQHLYIKFWKVDVDEVLLNAVSEGVLREYPFPIVIHNFMESELWAKAMNVYI